jgi:1-acyl-sn-glycerol-3-phosphate acyltransferase
VGRRLGFWRRFAVVTVKPLMTVMSRRDWRGMEHIPDTGPVIIVANHMSHADPLVLAHFTYDSGRWPRYLAKESLFRLPVLGRLLYWVGQVPVSRGTVDAVKALDAAIEAIRAGHCVLIYPEGTTSKEPDLWPMRGKTGAARLWLATGAPVVPVVMWGPERLFDPRTHKLRPVPQTPVTVVAGPAIDLSSWSEVAPTAVNLHEITDQIMLTLRDMLAEIRGGTPPPLWSPSAAGAERGAGAAGPAGPVRPEERSATAREHRASRQASEARTERGAGPEDEG